MCLTWSFDVPVSRLLKEWEAITGSSKTGCFRRSAGASRPRGNTTQLMPGTAMAETALGGAGSAASRS